MKNFTYKKKIITTLLLMVFLNTALLIFLKNDLSNSWLLSIKKLKEAVVEKISVFAQGMAPAFFPAYPQRLNYLALEIADASQNLVTLNEQLNNSLEKCDCQFTKSECKRIQVGFGKKGETGCYPGKTKVFGDPCQEERENVSAQQVGIKKELDRLASLQKVLQAEMQGGVESELAEMDSEDASNLRDNLQVLLEKTPQIISTTIQNFNLPAGCKTEKCTANCTPGQAFHLEACLKTVVGEQQPFKVKFEAGVSLKDIKLEPIKIKNLKLGLPDKIQTPVLPTIPSFKIPLPDVTITFPHIPVEIFNSKEFSLDSVFFHPTRPSLPEVPLLKTLCPQTPPSSPYDVSKCSGGGQSPLPNTGLNWYFQTLNWLSQECQELPAMKDVNSQLPTDRVGECFDSNNVSSVIVNECNSLWEEYLLVGPLAYQQKYHQTLPPNVCQLIQAPVLRQEAIIQQCNNLYEQEGEGEIPIDCGETSQSALAFLKGKCQKLNQAGRENTPEPCKVLSLFTQQIETPNSIDSSAPKAECPKQEIFDFALPGCPGFPPPIPKIPLSQLSQQIPQLPEINLPDYKISPFFEVTLPDFKFEQLKLPDIELCNLNDCSGVVPNLKFQLSVLDIPAISIPVFHMTHPKMDVEIGDLKIPPLPFRFEMPKMLSLTKPVIEVPEIPLPKPEFHFAFKGIEGLGGALTNFLLGLVTGVIPPIPEYCLSADIKYLPLRINYPDYIFSWPEFPKIPDACGDIRRFCQKVKSSLSDKKQKFTNVETKINTVLQKEVQAKLDKVGADIQKDIQKYISDEFDKQKTKFQQEINKSLTDFVIENGIVKISPARVDLEDITVPEINLTDSFSRSGVSWPSEIKFPWAPDSTEMTAQEKKEMKEITLGDEIIYELTNETGGTDNTIPLSRLGYSRVEEINIPGFQKPTPSLDFNFLEDYPSCVGGKPTGGNPCPPGKEDNLEKITNLSTEITNSSQIIVETLQ